MKNLSIPEIDLSPFWDSKEEGIKTVAEQIKYAYKNVGFAYLINHEIPQDVFDSAFKAAEEFHALPLKDKLEIKQNDCFRGYVPINASRLKVSTLGEAVKPNQLDAFVMAFEPEVNHEEYKPGVYLAGDNQWPSALPSLKSALCQYRDHMINLARNLIKIFAVALNSPQNALDYLFSPPTFFLRLQHYPAQPENTPEDVCGIAPHTDYGFFTLLAQRNIQGLEVKSTNDQWIVVPPKPGALILNSGDMLRRISNDTFLSTPHRVRNTSNTDRYSIPFFFEPNMYQFINVLEGCTNSKNPAKHPPIKYGEYLMDRIQGNYNLGKRS